MFSSKYAFGILSTELDMFIAKKKQLRTLCLITTKKAFTSHVFNIVNLRSTNRICVEDGPSMICSEGGPSVSRYFQFKILLWKWPILYLEFLALFSFVVKSPFNLDQLDGEVLIITLSL